MKGSVKFLKRSVVILYDGSVNEDISASVALFYLLLLATNSRINTLNGDEKNIDHKYSNQVEYDYLTSLE